MVVAVYGNLIYDQIVTVNDKIQLSESNPALIYNRIGGIANFARAAKINDLFDIKLVSYVGDDQPGNIISSYISNEYGIQPISIISDAKTSCAMNLVQTDSCQRTGFVDWGICSTTDLWSPIDADWHHLMYLDKMNITDLSRFSRAGVVSADLCDSHNIDNIIDKIKYVDVLFCSSVDSKRHKDLNSCKLPYKSIFIMHQPGFCSVAYRHSGLEFESTEVVPDLNVLGAGDYFAANCISSIISTAKVDIINSHNRTLKLLLEQTKCSD